MRLPVRTKFCLKVVRDVVPGPGGLVYQLGFVWRCGQPASKRGSGGEAGVPVHRGSREVAIPFFLLPCIEYWTFLCVRCSGYLSVVVRKWSTNTTLFWPNVRALPRLRVADEQDVVRSRELKDKKWLRYCATAVAIIKVSNYAQLGRLAGWQAWSQLTKTRTLRFTCTSYCEYEVYILYQCTVQRHLSLVPQLENKLTIQ